MRGLKTLGVRDLTYKLAFLACTVTPTNSKVGDIDFLNYFYRVFKFDLSVIKLSTCPTLCSVQKNMSDSVHSSWTHYLNFADSICTSDLESLNNQYVVSLVPYHNRSIFFLHGKGALVGKICWLPTYHCFALLK